MGLQEEFEQAVKTVKNLSKLPSDKELLDLYALYKQATVGDNNQQRPGLLNLRERAKHDAWATNKGMSSDDAMRKYIAMVDGLVAIYSVD